MVQQPHKLPFSICRCLETVAAVAVGPLLSLHHLLKPFEMRSWEQAPDDRILPIRTLLAVCLTTNCLLAKDGGAHAVLAVVALVLRDLGRLGQVSRTMSVVKQVVSAYADAQRGRKGLGFVFGPTFNPTMTLCLAMSGWWLTQVEARFLHVSGSPAL